MVRIFAIKEGMLISTIAYNDTDLHTVVDEIKKCPWISEDGTNKFKFYVNDYSNDYIDIYVYDNCYEVWPVNYRDTPAKKFLDDLERINSKCY